MQVGPLVIINNTTAARLVVSEQVCMGCPKHIQSVPCIGSHAAQTLGHNCFYNLSCKRPCDIKCPRNGIGNDIEYHKQESGVLVGVPGFVPEQKLSEKVSKVQSDMGRLDSKRSTPSNCSLSCSRWGSSSISWKQLLCLSVRSLADAYYRHSWVIPT